RRQVEQLFSIGSAFRVRAAAGGDLPLAGRHGGGLRVDFILRVGFVGGVGNPLAVGRESGLERSAFALHVKEELLVPERGQNPEVPFGLVVPSGVDDVAAVAAPVGGVLGDSRFEDQFLGSAAARRFLVEVGGAVLVGIIHDAAPIRRPERSALV